MRTILALTLATVLLFTACSPTTPSAQTPGPDGQVVPAAGELVAFEDCDELADYATEQAARWWNGESQIARSGAFLEEDALVDLAAPTAEAGAVTGDAPADPSTFSTTNNQEVGVDEADVVKTDGRLVLTTTDGTLRVLDATGREPTLVGSLELDSSGPHELLLHDDRVLVLSASDLTIPIDPQQQYPDGPEESWVATTVLTEVDISDPSDPTTVSSRQVDGSYHTARAIDGTARIVVASDPYFGGPVPEMTFDDRFSGVDPTDQLQASDLLPALTSTDGDGDTVREPLVDCEDVIRAEDPADDNTATGGAGTVTVLTVDLRQPLGDLRPTTVMGASEYVYASADHLYLAGTAWGDDGGSTTEIHQLSLEASEPARYESSGAVAGHPLNQFAFSEHDDHLRVATTDERWTDSDGLSDSAVTILERNDDELRQVGRVDGMGQGEQIYAVRFMGDTAYVVTFRQTDPLYTVDLSDPTDPRVVGELKIPGYSAYLHPVGDDLLLGVGQDADENGRAQGFQVSLFDVSDLASPRRVQQYELPNASSDTEYDHRAFLWWAADGLAVVPVNGYDRGNYVNAAVGLEVGRDAITEIGRIVHEGTSGSGAAVVPPPECPPEADCLAPIDYGPTTGTIARSLVIGDDQLWTVSELGVEISDVDTLTLEGWISFR